MAKRYLILGMGIAGFSAAAEIRALDASAEITMVGAEKPYLRPLLSKTDLRTFRRGKIGVAEEEWYAEQRINVLCGTEVSAISPAEHMVLLADGRSLSYDKCIYALGADCFVPPIRGRDKQGVLTLRNTRDFHTLRRLCMTAKNAVLIGGGIIGIEMAAQLHKIGIRCTVLEAAPRLMARQLDEESSRFLEKCIAKFGIPCHTGVQIAAITGSETVTGVQLADGRLVPAELVIFCTGVRAVTTPAAAAGLKCDRGVVTDDTLVTSDADILAAGDCLQCSIPNPGLWKYAQESGRIAGHNAVLPETPQTFCVGAFPVILTAMGMGLYARGETTEGAGVSAQTQQTPVSGEKPYFRVNHPESGSMNYEKRFYRDGKLVGAVLIGDISGMADIQNELQGGTV